MTDAELLVLSLIAQQPRHGYEIEQVLEASGLREWASVGFSSIYYLLQKLEREGLVEARTEVLPGKGPPRKVYHLTLQGLSAWMEATLEALSTPQPRQSRFPLALANLPGIPRRQTLEALRAYQTRLEGRLDTIGRRRSALPPDFDQALGPALDYEAHMLRAELRWLQDLLEQMEWQKTP
jgi:DNA-binding PadR family transcriptional regulator